MSKTQDKEHLHEEKKKAPKPVESVSPKEAPESSHKAKGKKVKITQEEHEKLLRARAELGELKDRLLRQMADFENAQKRLAREKEEFVTFSNQILIGELLPIMDHLDLAIAHSEDSDQSVEGIRSGVLLIRKQIEQVLNAHGTERIQAVGKPFDPNFHEALGHVENDQFPDETVAEELQAGYLLKGRLIRPAKVRIARSPKKETSAPPPSEGEDTGGGAV